MSKFEFEMVCFYGTIWRLRNLSLCLFENSRTIFSVYLSIFIFRLCYLRFDWQQERNLSHWFDSELKTSRLELTTKYLFTLMGTCKDYYICGLFRPIKKKKKCEKIKAIIKYMLMGKRSDDLSDNYQLCFCLFWLKRKRSSMYARFIILCSL